MEREHILKYIPEKVSIKTYGNLISFETSPNNIIQTCEALYHQHQLPLKIITAFDERKASGSFKIMYVFGVPKENIFLAPFIKVQDKFPSLTPTIHEASIYERKIKTFFGLNPEGHPRPRSLILHENWPEGVYPLRKDFDWQTRPDAAHHSFEFRKFEGEGIYEIPVGPVHAGIIEPGYFRFSVLGEEILLLEPRLGFSHKGIEKLFEVLPLPDKIKLAERISGDSSFSHSLAFCQALELLSDTKVSEQDQYLRVIFSELERLANHFGDLGFIMADAGFNFGGAHGARLRERVMQINEQLAGSRFLRNVNTLGGTCFSSCSLDGRRPRPRVQQGGRGGGNPGLKLDALLKDFSEVIRVAENSSSLFNRLQDTGVLDAQIALDHGVTGVAARALGFMRDARVDYPYAAYDKFPISIAIEKTGDVYARFMVRVKEVYSSFEILQKALAELKNTPSHPVKLSPIPLFKSNSHALSIVEGWRGDIVYLVSTNSEGAIDRVDIRDPSFLNWTALAYAGQGNMVPDFPLINKSFNLSYSGNDL